MVRSVLLRWVAALLIAVPTVVGAVEPDEILDDPVLEARARALSAELRCLVCQNQSIDDSEAPLAKDLRILLRERLSVGDSDEEVRAFMVARYGEFVLLKPSFSGANALLWLAPAMILIAGAGAAWSMFRRRRRVDRIAPLDDEEERALAAVLAEEPEVPGR